jgi:hypothetical protein
MPLDYPTTTRGSVTDEYFGQSVPDPYRWLENDARADRAVADWVEAQTLSRLPIFGACRRARPISGPWSPIRPSTPFARGRPTLRSWSRRPIPTTGSFRPTASNTSPLSRPLT